MFASKFLGVIFTKMRILTKTGRALFCASVIALLGVCAIRGAPADEFWDASFGVPGVPYEEGVVGSMLVLGANLYVGGVFTRIANLSTTSIARWDGTGWYSLGTGIDGAVFAMVHVRGEVFVAGNFTAAGGVPASYIANWNGSRWSDVGNGVNGIVFALASDGTNVYAGGHFTEAGGIAASKVAKWDGQNWSPLGSGIVPVFEGSQWVGAVDSLAVNGRDVFAGGRFRNAGGTGATNVARWDGTNWHALGNGLRYYDGPGSENGAVRALTVHKGILFAGGEFRMAGRTGATNIACWDADSWLSVGESVNDGLSIQVLASAGNVIYAGGAFRMIGGVVANRLAKWDGRDWSSLGSGIAGQSGDGVIAIASNGGDLFIGGLFPMAGGKPSTNIALWHIPHSLDISHANGELRLSWPATGTNFLLEAKDNVAGTNWSEVSQPPALHNTECVVTQTVSGPMQFYRLRRL